MPYNFHLYPERALFLVTCKGVITEDDLYDFRATVLAETRLEKATKRLYDARQVTGFTFSSFTLWRMLSNGRAPAETQRAFVLAHPSINNLSIRIALKLSSKGRHSKVYFDMNEALSWLGLAHDEVYPNHVAALA